MEVAHRLVRTRRGTLVLSLIAALLAGAMILVYLNRYRNSVKAEAAPVTVLVARQAIPKGTPGSVIAAKGLYTTTTIRESQLLDGAFSDPSSLRGKVAAQEVYQGAQLTAADFAAGTTSLAGALTDSQRIVSVPLDSAHGLIGDVQVGNRVDVYAGFNVVPVDKDGAPVAGGQARPMLKLIVPNVPVVAIASKGSGIASSSSTTNVSLRVNDRDAAKLAFASDNGKIWLALRPSTGAKPSSPSIVTVDTLLLGVPPVKAMQALGGR